MEGRYKNYFSSYQNKKPIRLFLFYPIHSLRCSKFLLQRHGKPSPDSQQMLCELGEELGISDLYTQKEILERYRSRMQQMEAEQRETSRKKIRLYQSMGLLAGMAVAILLC